MLGLTESKELRALNAQNPNAARDIQYTVKPRTLAALRMFFAADNRDASEVCQRVYGCELRFLDHRKAANWLAQLEAQRRAAENLDTMRVYLVHRLREQRMSGRDYEADQTRRELAQVDTTRYLITGR